MSPGRGKGGKSREPTGEEKRDQENRRFFQQHKDEEWFQEKYDPEQVQKQREELLAHAQKQAEEFAAELGAGSLAPCYNFVEPVRQGAKAEDKEDGEPEAEEPKEEVAPAAATDGATTIFIRSLPPKVKRAQLQEFLKPTSLKLSEPIATKDWVRNAWASYDSSTLCSDAYNKCKSEELDGLTLDMALTPPNRRAGPAKAKITNRAFADERRIAHDLEQARLLVQHLDSEKGLVPNEALASEDSGSASADLDLQILYLRRIHVFDYYSGEEFRSTVDLESKSPAGWLRGRAPDREVENRIVTKQEGLLDSKIRNRLENKWSMDERAIGDKMAGFQKKFLEDNTIKVEEDKFGCSFSSKLFMATEFVHKHIINKHSAKLDEAKTAEYARIYFENYKNDQQHPQNNAMAPAFGKGKGDWGKGKGDWGRGGYKGGKGYSGDRFRGRSPPRYDRRFSPPRDRGSPRFGSAPQNRSIRSYHDLDDTAEDVAPINFDELDALDAMMPDSGDEKK